MGLKPDSQNKIGSELLFAMCLPTIHLGVRCSYLLVACNNQSIIVPAFPTYLNLSFCSDRKF